MECLEQENFWKRHCEGF